MTDREEMIISLKGDLKERLSQIDWVEEDLGIMKREVDCIRHKLNELLKED